MKKSTPSIMDSISHSIFLQGETIESMFTKQNNNRDLLKLAYNKKLIVQQHKTIIIWQFKLIQKILYFLKLKFNIIANVKISFIMKKDYLEISVGFVIILFSIIFVLFTMKMTNKKINQEYYHLFATFNNIEGINVGTKIKIGGIEVGEVGQLVIDDKYKVVIKMKIRKSMKIPVDSNVKVSTSGLIGGKYLKIEVGGEEEYMEDGDSFEFTESTMDLEDMITRFMLNSANKKKDSENKQ